TLAWPQKTAAFENGLRQRRSRFHVPAAEPERMTMLEGLSLKGHTGQVWSVAFNPDGKRLASASNDNTVKVWDAQTGQELFTLKGHTGRVSSVALGPDGNRMASCGGGLRGSGPGELKVWDAQTGQELLTLRWRGATSVAFSPDGTRLASGGSGRPVGRG